MGAQFLASRFHAALGCERGTGKTVMALRAARMVGAKRVLVTCPASVRSSWEEHIAEEFGGTEGWRVISYNQACKEPASGAFDVWIGDEIHFTKNLDSARSKAIFGPNGLARRARYKWCLSGTMAPNGRPIELYPMLKALAPAFRTVSFNEYAREYCGAFFDGYAWNVKGASRVEELSVLLRGFMLRRTLNEVYPNRIEPIVSRIPVDLSPADLKAVWAEEEAIGGRESRISSRFDKFSQMGDSAKLLRLLGLAKERAAADFVKDQLKSVDKVVIFAHHLGVVDGLAARLAAFHPAIYCGGMSDGQKDGEKARFVGEPACRVFIGARSAAGTGINDLQRVCSTAVIAEPSWVPGETEQLIGRLDRIGQKAPLVRAYVLFAKGTLDAVVVGTHDRKAATGEKLMGDGVVDWSSHL